MTGFPFSLGCTTEPVGYPSVRQLIERYLLNVNTDRILLLNVHYNKIYFTYRHRTDG
ncbi:MAG: hypothetical protein ACTTJH_06695 [Bacteroidales bacterium]